MIDTYLPDLDAYCARIGYGGPRNTNLQVLNELTAHHTRSIPFENIDIPLGRGIDISPEAVERKLVFEKRGGYCFEQNQLLLLVLKALGFDAQTLSARVRWQLPRTVTPPRTHIFIQVTLPEGEWITDVGVGGNSLTAALKWEDGLIQKTSHDERRLIFEDGLWFHQTRFHPEGEWLDVCEFTGDDMPLIDRDIANWWTSTNNESKFRKNIIASRSERDGCRLSLLNREFVVRRRGSVVKKQELSHQDQLLEVLKQEFNLEIPSDDSLEKLLTQ